MAQASKLKDTDVSVKKNMYIYIYICKKGDIYNSLIGELSGYKNEAEKGQKYRFTYGKILTSSLQCSLHRGDA